MKILSLLFILTISSLGLSAQDTIPAKHLTPSEQSKAAATDGGRIHDTFYVIRPQNLISGKRVRHIRNAAIVLSSVGGGFTIGGIGLVVGGIRPAVSDNTNLSIAVVGASLIYGGIWVNLTGIGTWIAYGVKHHKYKKQLEYLEPHR